ncbi:MAG: hypothetical protein ACM3KD_00975 [Hyphomicrobiaceae bacterium]
MHARLHRFLLLLLMLTLPLQAFAYSAMQVCTIVDQGAAEQVAMPGEGMAMAGCHTPDHPHSSPAQHECKYCAACALASALPIELAGSTPVVPLAHSFASQPAASFSGFIPDGPERPPRPSLA